MKGRTRKSNCRVKLFKYIYYIKFENMGQKFAIGQKIINYDNVSYLSFEYLYFIENSIKNSFL